MCNAKPSSRLRHRSSLEVRSESLDPALQPFSQRVNSAKSVPKRRKRTDRSKRLVYLPRQWVWGLAFWIIISVLGLLFSKPPSIAAYYRYKLYGYILTLWNWTMVLQRCLTQYAFYTQGLFQDEVVPWMIKIWKQLRDRALPFVNRHYHAFLDKVPDSHTWSFQTVAGATLAVVPRFVEGFSAAWEEVWCVLNKKVAPRLQHPLLLRVVGICVTAWCEYPSLSIQHAVIARWEPMWQSIQDICFAKPRPLTTWILSRPKDLLLMLVAFWERLLHYWWILMPALVEIGLDWKARIGKPKVQDTQASSDSTTSLPTPLSVETDRIRRPYLGGLKVPNVEARSVWIFLALILTIVILIISYWGMRVILDSPNYDESFWAFLNARI